MSCNYRPNLAAQALVTGRSNTLGMVSVDSLAFGPASVLRALERAAQRAGFLVSVARLDVLRPRGAARARSSSCNARASQASSSTPATTGSPSGLAAARPTSRSSRSRDVPEAAVPVVALDQPAGAAAATRLLLDLGHPTVAHVAGPRTWSSARRRTDGWRATLEAAGAEVAAPLFGDWTVRSGHELGRQLACDAEVTAVFAANDEMALGVMRAMYEAGREVPGGRQHHRLRRRPLCPLPDAAPDHRAPGLRRDRPAWRAEMLLNAIQGADDALGARRDHPRAGRPREHRPGAHPIARPASSSTRS